MRSTSESPLLFDRRVALALYRGLSQGRPVSAAELAGVVQLSENDAVDGLRGWPGVYYDDSRRVIGFWGLTIVPMPHRLLSNGLVLYAWCAWDTLFLPELIGGPLDVESTCRTSGQPVRLTATPAAVQHADLSELVLSFLAPDSDRINADVITSFCHYVHFLALRTPRSPGWPNTGTRSCFCSPMRTLLAAASTTRDTTNRFCAESECRPTDYSPTFPPPQFEYAS